MRAVVTGGAGFLGSHLCRRLLSDGWEVICFDSFFTGEERNVADLADNPRFRLERHDVTNDLEVEGKIDWILHLASPASPADYLRLPIDTLKVGAIGTWRAAGLASSKGAGLFLASTSEVYGDPEVHPQSEEYRGNVDPVGPRGVYDEAKRYAEALVMAYHRVKGIPVRIARIFNTYGPGMRRRDGRVVPTFISQALSGEPLTVHGTGQQTRSLCFVDDMIEGICSLIGSDLNRPVNLGRPEEVSVLELAERIRRACTSTSEVMFTDRPVDDPKVRRPDISVARDRLGWEPNVSLEEGIDTTVEWAKRAWFGEGI